MVKKTSVNPEILLKQAIVLDKTLRKQLRIETDRNIKKKINKQLRGNLSRFPMLKRKIYENNKESGKYEIIKKNKESFEIVATEKERKQLLEKVIKQKKEKPVILLSKIDEKSSSQKICSSCGTPLRDVYGVIRCKCN